MEIFQAIILGIIQGLTEWLPISSSGHLVLTQRLMNTSIPVAYDVMLHIGTLIPVFIIFRKDILRVFRGFLTFNKKNEDFRFGIYIIIASAITGLIGIAFLKFFESLFASTLTVGIGLIISGVFLFASKFFKNQRKIEFKDSVIIGLAQALSIVPGISRSGLTISTGLIRKIDKKSVFTFSFLLSIVAVIGAQLVELKGIDFSGIGLTSLIAGIATSAIVGYAAIKLLLRTILSEKFHWFALYCFILGLIVIFVL
jgi:undecaprenyl-diphosphatase